MTKNDDLRDGLKIGVSNDDEPPREAYATPQSGGPRGHSLHEEERDPWDYDDDRDEVNDDDDDDLKDEDELNESDLDDEDEEIEEPDIDEDEEVIVPDAGDLGNKDEVEDEEGDVEGETAELPDTTPADVEPEEAPIVESSFQFKPEPIAAEVTPVGAEP